MKSQALSRAADALFKNQQRFLGVCEEAFHDRSIGDQDLPNRAAAAITCPEMDELRRVSSQERAMHKIAVFGDDNEPIVRGETPYLFIVRSAQPAVFDVL
jgi:hypothetical protein